MLDARSDRYIRFILPKPLKVIVCAITLVAFVFNIVSYDIAWADRTPSALTSVGADRAVSPVSPGDFKELHVKTFSLPQSLGTIKDSWSYSQHPTPNTQHPTIIHIQDAHCNYYAQHKINDIIEYINKEYGIDTINLEGGAEGYDLLPFTHIADARVRAKVSDHFVKEGLVNGAEYFAINNPDKVKLWGIEDAKLYIENLNVYRDSLKYKDDADKLLKNTSRLLANLKMKIYSKDLLSLDLKYNQYKAGNLEFKDYLDFLMANSRDKLIDIKSFPNIFLLDQTLAQESEIDFSKANNERDQLIDSLQKKLSKNALKELVAKTVEFKSENISQEEFYGYLVNKAKAANISVENFPEVEKYIVYISSYAAIDKSRVNDEITALEARIREALYQNDDQRKLDKLSKNLAILKNIFNISLTRADYEYYKANEDSFDMRNYASFVDKEAPLCGIDARLDEGVTRLDGYRSQMEKFYECSFKRDEAFLKNIRLQGVGSRVKGIGPNTTLHPTPYNLEPNRVAIVITGGFHTDNLCELFKKQGISYISIVPNFKTIEGYGCPYFSLLKGDMNVAGQKIASAILGPDQSVMAVAAIATALGKEVWGERNISIFNVEVHMQYLLDSMEQVVIKKPDGSLVLFTKEDDDNIAIRNIEDDSEKAQINENNILTLAEFINQVHFITRGEDVKNIRVSGLNVDTLLGDKNVKKALDILGITKESIKDKIKLYHGFGSNGSAGDNIVINADQPESEIAQTLIHELVAGIYGQEGHSFVEKITEGILKGEDVAKGIDQAKRYGKPIWEMTLKERTQAERDFARQAITNPPAELASSVAEAGKIQPNDRAQISGREENPAVSTRAPPATSNLNNTKTPLSFYLYFTTTALIIVGWSLIQILVIDWSNTCATFAISHILFTALITRSAASMIADMLFYFIFNITKGPYQFKNTPMPHGIPDRQRSLLAYMLLSTNPLDSKLTVENMFKSYMDNLDQNGNLTAVLVSAAKKVSIVKYEMDLRDEYREKIDKTLTDEAAAIHNARIRRDYAGLKETPRFAMWMDLFDRWEASGVSGEALNDLIQNKIETFKNNFKYIHRTTTVLKKPGQYQDLMILASRGIDMPYTYIDERYGSYKREAGLRCFGFQENKNIINDTNIPNDEYQSMLVDLEQRGSQDIEDLKVAGNTYNTPNDVSYRYTVLCDYETRAPPSSIKGLVEIIAANPDRGCLQPALGLSDIETWHGWRASLTYLWMQHIPETVFRIMNRFGFYGKGIVDNEMYIDRIIGTPDKPIEALPVDIMSHDTIEALYLNPAWVHTIKFIENPARNSITEYVQGLRWTVGDIKNIGYMFKSIQFLIDKTKQLYAHITGVRFEKPWRRDNEASPSFSAKYVANFPTRNVINPFLYLTWIVIETFAVPKSGMIALKDTPLQMWSFIGLITLLVILPKLYSTFIDLIDASRALIAGDLGKARGILRLTGKKAVAGLVDIVVSPFAYFPDAINGVVRAATASMVIIAGKVKWKPQADIEREMAHLTLKNLSKYTWHVPVVATVFVGAALWLDIYLHPIMLIMLFTWLVMPISTVTGSIEITSAQRKGFIFKLSDMTAESEKAKAEPAFRGSYTPTEVLKAKFWPSLTKVFAAFFSLLLVLANPSASAQPPVQSMGATQVASSQNSQAEEMRNEIITRKFKPFLPSGNGREGYILYSHIKDDGYRSPAEGRYSRPEGFAYQVKMLYMTINGNASFRGFTAANARTELLGLVRYLNKNKSKCGFLPLYVLYGEIGSSEVNIDQEGKINMLDNAFLILDLLAAYGGICDSKDETDKAIAKEIEQFLNELKWNLVFDEKIGLFPQHYYPWRPFEQRFDKTEGELKEVYSEGFLTYLVGYILGGLDIKWDALEQGAVLNESPDGSFRWIPKTKHGALYQIPVFLYFNPDLNKALFEADQNLVDASLRISAQKGYLLPPLPSPTPGSTSYHYSIGGLKDLAVDVVDDSFSSPVAAAGFVEAVYPGRGLSLLGEVRRSVGSLPDSYALRDGKPVISLWSATDNAFFMTEGLYSQKTRSDILNALRHLPQGQKRYERLQGILNRVITFKPVPSEGEVRKLRSITENKNISRVSLLTKNTVQFAFPMNISPAHPMTGDNKLTINYQSPDEKWGGYGIKFTAPQNIRGKWINISYTSDKEVYIKCELKRNNPEGGEAGVGQNEKILLNKTANSQTVSFLVPDNEKFEKVTVITLVVETSRLPSADANVTINIKDVSLSDEPIGKRSGGVSVLLQRAVSEIAAAAVQGVPKEGTIAAGSLEKRIDDVKTMDELRAFVPEITAPEQVVTDNVRNASVELIRLIEECLRGKLSDDDSLLLNQTLQILQNNPAFYYFSDIIQGSENYLLGFGKEFNGKKITGISAELAKSLSQRLLTEYIFHEILETITPQGEHKNLYTGIQRKVFGEDNPLKRELRNHIEQASVILSLDENMDLAKAKEFVNKARDAGKRLLVIFDLDKTISADNTRKISEKMARFMIRALAAGDVDIAVLTMRDQAEIDRRVIDQLKLFGINERWIYGGPGERRFISVPHTGVEYFPERRFSAEQIRGYKEKITEILGKMHITIDMVIKAGIGQETPEDKNSIREETNGSLTYVLRRTVLAEGRDVRDNIIRKLRAISINAYRGGQASIDIFPVNKGDAAEAVVKETAERRGIGHDSIAVVGVDDDYRGTGVGRPLLEKVASLNGLPLTGSAEIKAENVDQSEIPGNAYLVLSRGPRICRAVLQACFRNHPIEALEHKTSRESGDKNKVNIVSRGGEIMRGRMFNTEFFTPEREKANQGIVTVAVDFDHTIIARNASSDYFIRPGILEELKKLRDSGIRLVGFTDKPASVVEQIFKLFPQLQEIFELTIPRGAFSIDFADIQRKGERSDAYQELKKAYQGRIDAVLEYLNKFPGSMKDINLLGYALIIDDQLETATDEHGRSAAAILPSGPALVYNPGRYSVNDKGAMVSGEPVEGMAEKIINILRSKNAGTFTTVMTTPAMPFTSVNTGAPGQLNTNMETINEPASMPYAATNVSIRTALNIGPSAELLYVKELSGGNNNGGANDGLTLEVAGNIGKITSLTDKKELTALKFFIVDAISNAKWAIERKMLAEKYGSYDAYKKIAEAGSFTPEQVEINMQARKAGLENTRYTIVCYREGENLIVSVINNAEANKESFDYMQASLGLSETGKPLSEEEELARLVNEAEGEGTGAKTTGLALIAASGYAKKLGGNIMPYAGPGYTAIVLMLPKSEKAASAAPVENANEEVLQLAAELAGYGINPLEAVNLTETQVRNAAANYLASANNAPPTEETLARTIQGIIDRLNKAASRFHEVVIVWPEPGPHSVYLVNPSGTYIVGKGERADVEGSLIGPLTVRIEKLNAAEKAGGAATQNSSAFLNSPEIKERTKAVVAAYKYAGERESIVKTVVGVPADLDETQTQKVILEANKALAANGYGEREDNHQMIQYKIYEDNMQATMASLDGAMTKAQDGLPENGRVVAFVLQDTAEDGVTPKMPDDAIEKYGNRKNITLVLDAYRDRFAKVKAGAIKEKKVPVCPSLTLRGALARQINWYYQMTNDADRTDAIERINALRKQASSENKRITQIWQLRDLPLIVDTLCRDMEELRAMEEAIASSA